MMHLGMFLTSDISFEMRTEFLHETLGGPRTGFTEGADGAAFDVVGDALQFIHVGGRRDSRDDTVADLLHPQAAFPARGALAAGFVRVERINVIEDPGDGSAQGRTRPVSKPPALCRPSEKPPMPANMSMTRRLI